MKAVALVLGLMLAVAAAVPVAEWEEPTYVDEQGYELDATMLHSAEDAPLASNEPDMSNPPRFVELSADKSEQKTEAKTEQAPLPAAAGNAIPGPWFGSYAARMDPLGYNVPPYAFDPAKFSVLGPYRALTNRYSDGTPYPLNMQKFDYFKAAAGEE